MKTRIGFGIVMLALTLALSPRRGECQPVPGVAVYAATGGTTSAQCLVPALPGYRAVITGLTATSDKSSAVLSLRSTTSVTEITVANTNTTAVTNVVTSNAGFAANDIALLQKSTGLCYTATVSSVDSATNLVLNSGGFGAAVVAGDTVGRLGSSIIYKYCNCTASYQGACIFVAPEGRAICALLDGTSACSIDAISVNYTK